MTRSDGGSSDMALHRDVVASCWESPCKLAALMNLRGNTRQRGTNVRLQLMLWIKPT